jgi:hypothetical protein
VDAEWQVSFSDEFDLEFYELPRAVRIEIAAKADLLRQFGPHLERPHADTLAGSRYTNMKELRFHADGGVWRVAFAFDPERRAILLVAGDKSGVAVKRFYRRLIDSADLRYERHLKRLRRTLNG